MSTSSFKIAHKLLTGAGAIEQLADGTARSLEQVGEVTLAPKLGLADARIDWNQPADAVYQRVRGVTPEPGATSARW